MPALTETESAQGQDYNEQLEGILLLARVICGNDAFQGLLRRLEAAGVDTGMDNEPESLVGASTASTGQTADIGRGVS